jgi:penicillin-binding protein 1C
MLKRVSRRGRWILAAWTLCVASIAAFATRVTAVRLPATLEQGAFAAQSIRVTDRDGRLLREVRGPDATRSEWLALEDVGDRVLRAMLAAEDARFFAHPGVDPIAVVRAAVSNVRHERIVSGASTLTMQLARLLHPHPRTWGGKIDDVAMAVRIEASLPKRRILEEYLNRAPFGPGVRGIAAASRFWLDKAPRDLSLAEAATLSALPRGPALYAIDRHPERMLWRRDRILDRMGEQGWATPEEIDRAKREPLATHLGKGGFGAPQLVEALVRGQAPLWPAAEEPAPRTAGVSSVQTTLSGDLQRAIEVAAREQIARLRARHVTAAAVVVIDNATGDLLAYVGSPDFADNRHGGQNDGVRARRQPGSTLKPFVYGLALERLGWTAATVLPDVELHLAVEGGMYSPMNYDERFHGPVRLREALGSSLNIPAVWAATRTGLGPLLERLRALGFESLSQTEDWYGPALALGDGEVTLLELANAYATLARGGLQRDVRSVIRITRGGQPALVQPGAERRVMPREVADVVTDIVADPNARMAAFGEGTVLDFPFDVAAKTGTSKGFRDNWTVGFTRQVTVAAWVGNFDGSPMQATSGITGAGPLFHVAMEAAMRGRTAEPLRLDRRDRSGEEPAESALVAVEVCPLSGGRPTHACPTATREWMAPQAAERLEPCAMHESVAVDLRNGLRAGPACPVEVTRRNSFERLDGRFRAWAVAAGRKTGPDRFSPLCPPPGRVEAERPLRIAWPNDDSRFVIDPERPRDQQQLLARVDAPAGVASVEMVIDGHPLGRLRSPFVARWPLEPGDHVMVARSDDARTSEPVRVHVE